MYEKLHFKNSYFRVVGEDMDKVDGATAKGDGVKTIEGLRKSDNRNPAMVASGKMHTRGLFARCERVQGQMQLSDTWKMRVIAPVSRNCTLGRSGSQDSFV